MWSIIKPYVRFIVHPDIKLPKPIKYKFSEMEKAIKLIGQIHVEYPGPSFQIYYIPDISEVTNKDIYNHNLRNFLQLCATFGLKCISPEPLFNYDPEKLYIPMDRHFSELGTSVVARSKKIPN